MVITTRLLKNLNQSILEIQELLQEKKVTKRKEGLKNLDLLLDSPDFLDCLDDRTARLQPDGPLIRSTWPGLVKIFTRHIDPRNTPGASKTFKRLVQLTEESKRRSLGRTALLERCANSLVDHTANMLQAASLALTSQHDKDYFGVFKLILEEPVYCAAASPDTWSYFVDIHLDYLNNNKWPNEKRDDAHRAMTSLATVLRNYPGEPSPEQKQALVSWLIDAGAVRLKEGDSVAAASRFYVDALDVAVSFLAGSGRDVASQCPAIHAALHRPASVSLKGRDGKAKERAVAYLRMQLQLGGVTQKQLAQLRRWAVKESSTPQWKAAHHMPTAAPLTSSQYAILSLMAAVHAHADGVMNVPLPVEQIDEEDDGEDTAIGGTGGSGSGAVTTATAGGGGGQTASTSTVIPTASTVHTSVGDGDERPRKRVRTSSGLEELGSRAATAPAAAAPVACTLLLHYTRVFPEKDHQVWVSNIAAALPACIEQATAPEQTRIGSLLWLLRFAHSLAVAAQLDASGALRSNETAWSYIWQTLVKYLNQPEIQAAEQQAALWVLYTIASRRLFALPTTAHMIWGIPLLSWSPTPAGVAVAESALRCGVDSAAHAGLWEKNILQWVLGADAAGDSSCNVASAVEAYLRVEWSYQDHLLPSYATPQDAPSFAALKPAEDWVPWVWWQADGADELKIAGLIRGVAYMQAKARVAANAAAQKRLQELEAAKSVPSSGAGLQMHQQAANALRAAVATATAAAQHDDADDDGAPRTSMASLSPRTNHLTALLTTCATAIRVSTSAAIASKEFTGNIPSCWRPNAPLAEDVRNALISASTMLVETICTVEGLSIDTEDALSQLIIALKAHYAAFDSTELAVSSLSEALPKIAHVFSLKPASVAAAAAAATQAPTQFAAVTSVHAAAAFDDELDMGVPATIAATARPTMAAGAAAGGSTAVASSAALAEHYKRRCAALLLQFSPLMPLHVSTACSNLLTDSKTTQVSESVDSAPAPPALSTRLRLVEALTSSAAAAVRHRNHEGPEIVKTALEELESVLFWDGKKQKLGAFGRMNVVLERARDLADALASPHGLGTIGDAVKVMAELISYCLDICFEHKHVPDRGNLTSCALRVVMGAAGVEVFSVVRNLDEGRANRIADWLGSLVIDDCYSARLSGSELVQQLFPKFVDPAGPFTNLKNMLPLSSNLLAVAAAQPTSRAGRRRNNADDIDTAAFGNIASSSERIETAVFFLGETAAAHDVLEMDCMLELARQAAADVDNNLPLALAIADWVALSLSYPDRYAYAAWCQPRLLYAWIAEISFPLDSLSAVRTLVAPSPRAAARERDFFSAAAASLVGVMVLLQNRLGLEDLALKLGVSLEDLLINNLDGVLSLCLPGLQTNDEVVKQACTAAFSGVLKDVLGENWHLQYANSNVVSGIARMLAAAHGPPPPSQQDAASGAVVAPMEPLRPFYKPETIVKAIRELPGGNTPEEIDFNLWTRFLGQSQIATVLSHVQTHIQSARHSRHMTAAVGALRAALLLLGNRVATPSTLRYVISILLRLLRFPLLRTACCEMLSSVLHEVLTTINTANDIHSSSQAARALGSLLPALVSSLAEVIQRATEDGYNTERLLLLLNALTVKAPRALHEYLPTVDPFPAEVGMQEASRVVSKHRETITVPQQLQAFAARAAAMSLTERQRSIQALRTLFSSQPDALYDENSSAVSVTARVGAAAKRCSPEVAASAWRLALLSSDLQDPHLSEFSAELLASAGPLQPSTLAFNASVAEHVVGSSSSSSGIGISSSTVADSDTPPSNSSNAAEQATWISALRLLSDYAIDESTAVVKSAQKALRYILATPEGQTALSKLDDQDLTKSLIGVFAEDANNITKEKLSNSNTATAPVEEPSIWNLQHAPSYDVWVCRLAKILCTRADNDAIYNCRGIVCFKPAFAELILPLACRDLALHHAGDHDQDLSVSASVAHLIAQGLLPACPTEPKAMRLLLHCLNHLRSVRLDVTMHNASGDVNNAIKEWPKVYWFDLDYLQLASAAVKCRAYFSALLYVEEWCQEVHPSGFLKLPEATSSNPRRTEAEALLLEVYSKINEPDGLYAVAQSNDLLSQLRRSEREGDWSAVLVACDLALQLADGSGNGGSGRAGGEQQHMTVSRQAAEAGISRALSNLGASSLLATLARARAGGLGGGGGAAAADVGSAASTSAAEGLGTWTPLDPGSGESSEPTDESLSAAVAALSSGSAERCSQAVGSARRALVASLAAAGLESAGDVNPALVRLQMLQEVSEAWDLRWPELPNLGASFNSPNRTLLLREAGNSNGDVEMLAADIEQSPAFQQAMERWRSREASAGSGGRYSLQAPLQDLRLQLLRTLGTCREQALALEEAAVAARETSHFGQAAGCLFKLRKLAQDGVSSGQPWAAEVAAPAASWRAEEAKLLWARGQTDAALSTLRAILPAAAADAADGRNSTMKPTWEPYLQSLSAHWLATTQRESSATIVRELRDAAKKVGGSVGAVDPATTCGIVYRLAHYTDGLYRAIQEQMASDEWKVREEVLKFKETQLEMMQERMKAKKKAGLDRVITVNGRQRYQDSEMWSIYNNVSKVQQAVEQDRQELGAIKNRERQHLLHALQAYYKCLMLGGEYDLQSMFRVIQLWLSLATDTEVVSLVNDMVINVASYKFISLSYQVASRLSAAREGALVVSGFQDTLKRLLVRLGIEHPFHSLVQVLALKNGNRGLDGKPIPVATAADGTYGFAADADRVKAASQVLSEVTQAGQRQKLIVKELEEVSDQYITLAAVPVPEGRHQMTVPSSLRRLLVKCTHIPILSATLPVDRTLQYINIPTVASVDSTITFPGGINKPKKINLIDVVGKTRTELCKGGNDDLRQDAVMQQYFGLLNEFLAEAPATASRGLGIRTYRCVPLSPAAGLLEWVDNTTPIGTLITQRRYGADVKSMSETARYRLDSIHKACRNKNNKRLVASVIRPVYDQVVDTCAPTLHHHFLEQHRDPGAWFEARLAYTRSVAASSMAGHIIGLGDRHCTNILVDTESSEVVHIDLGIAFDQGKFLTTAERVPFRLTRNVIDGMGVAGVEGVMRRCCEATLRVLRDQKEPLLTVMEVFIHDPLYKWGLTFIEAQKRQQPHGGQGQAEEPEAAEGGNGAPAPAAQAGPAAGAAPAAVENRQLVGNTDANRTIMKIRQKLEGIESGDMAARSVEGQVAHLFAEAMNRDNLCLMFPGWQPHL